MKKKFSIKSSCLIKQKHKYMHDSYIRYLTEVFIFFKIEWLQTLMHE